MAGLSADEMEEQRDAYWNNIVDRLTALENRMTSFENRMTNLENRMTHLELKMPDVSRNSFPM